MIKQSTKPAFRFSVCMKFTLHHFHRHYFLHKGHRKWTIFLDHFLQKTQRTHVFIAHRSEANGLQRWRFLKCYNSQKWESKFASGWSKSVSNKNCWALNFLQKTQCAHMSISHRSGARVFQRLPWMDEFLMQTNHFRQLTVSFSPVVCLRSTHSIIY